MLIVHAGADEDNGVTVPPQPAARNMPKISSVSTRPAAPALSITVTLLTRTRDGVQGGKWKPSADIGEKAINQLRDGARQLPTRSPPADKAAKLAEILATGTWTHDYPITFEQAQHLGVKVRADMPAEMLQLMSLFRQAVRRQPSVEYIPTRRAAEPARAPTAPV